MRRPLRRVLLVGAAAAATVLGASTMASAAGDGTSVMADAQCSAGSGGVVDITLINDGEQTAVFQVAGASYEVAPLDAHALTYEGVANGTFNLAVTANGADESVSVTVSCDSPIVAAQAVQAPRSSGTLPTTGGEVGWGLAIGGALVVAGVAASLLARRRHYS